MNSKQLGSRYAKALFELQRNELEKGLFELESFSKLLELNPKLLKLLKSPQLLFEHKRELLQASLKDRVSQYFFYFILYLLKKRALDLLPTILSNYRYLVNNELKILEATLITAISIDLKVEQKMQEKLEQTFQKKVKLNQEIQPKMIGGAVLLMGNAMIDWSIRARLKKFKANLLVEGA